MRIVILGANLKIKSQLMELRQQLTQLQASELLGVTRPRVSDVTIGKFDKCTIDAPVNMPPETGLKLMSAFPPGRPDAEL